MCAATIDFAAERRFVEASDDPHEVLDWIGEYRQHAREAAAERDNSLERRFDDLIEFATDHVVELKAARLRPPTRLPAAAEEEVRTPRFERMLSHQTINGPAQAAPVVRAPAADTDHAARNDWARRRVEEQAAAKAAAEQAEAEQERVDQEELRQLQARAVQAKARRDAALAATARIEAETKRAAAEVDRARREAVKRKAAQAAEDAERMAAEAEATARAALASAARATGLAESSTHSAHPVASIPTDRQDEESGTESAPELTALAMLFQEQLAGVAAKFSNPLPVATAAPSRHSGEASPALPEPLPAAPAANVQLPTPIPAMSRTANAPAIPPKWTAPAPPTTAETVDDLPPLTGADLTSFRNSLAVSQRALATRLDVEQSSISKGEGKPTTILPPSLRKALHQAMSEPRPDVRGAA